MNIRLSFDLREKAVQFSQLADRTTAVLRQIQPYEKGSYRRSQRIPQNRIISDELMLRKATLKESSILNTSIRLFY